MNAVGYFSATAASGAAGLRSQEARFYRHCDAAGLRALATFSDTEPGPRTGFVRLLHFLERTTPPVTVVVEGPERLGDSPREMVGRALELETLGARLSAIQDTPADLLVALLSAAEAGRKPAFSHDKARQQLQNKAMQAQGLGKTPFGYHIGPDGRFVVVHEEAKVVELIYRWYTQEHLGLRLIAGRLNEQGVTTRRGARWSVVTVRDILRNPVYQGTYARFGLMVSGSHTAVVSRETFRRAQERRRAAASERKEPEEVSFALSGLVNCGYCGNHMVGATRHQSWTRRDRSRVRAVYRYYRCGSRVNQSICGYHTHRAEDLEAGVAADVLAHWANESQSRPDRFHLARAQALREGVTPYVKDAVAGRLEPKELREVAAELLGAARSAEQAAARSDPAPGPTEPGEGLPVWLGPGAASQRAVLRGMVRRIVVLDDRRETEVRDPVGDCPE